MQNQDGNGIHREKKRQLNGGQGKTICAVFGETASTQHWSGDDVPSHMAAETAGMH
jgi:hypothetical protein